MNMAEYRKSCVFLPDINQENVSALLVFLVLTTSTIQFIIALIVFVYDDHLPDLGTPVELQNLMSSFLFPDLQTGV